jgi:uncharacterized membrane protein YjgN (DUF898 family)
MENIQDNRKIEIGPESLGHLNTMRKWTIFFAILGFIGLGIMLIIGLTFGTFMSAFTSKINGAEGVQTLEAAKPAGDFTGLIIISAIIIFTVIYLIPLIYLVKFSRHTAHAILKLDGKELQTGLKYLKRYWVYIGILIIVSFSIYLVAFIFLGSTLSQIKGIT